ncbi:MULTISPECIES: AfsR/SARP family transcriptional regulator [Streptosporangium]|uniref:DNA-binding SARP family transcriptional activator n=1 Tax=Streptosporangium brasiliense TaxID=47480 RepID=A0ABT9QWP2_9ACTN|nr:AfsR/SARP family transcriptional regulator [Streptosporangium brasiliense]MDP9861399.1 DNA-binding SARP family transcriptional activator [Streptosporangium brasiliense]
MVEFKVLGPLEISSGSRAWRLTAPRQQQIMGLLLLSANQIIDANSLILELWGENPPKSAMTTVQTYIYQLRKLFDHEGIHTTAAEILTTRPPGYSLEVNPEQIDVFAFRELVQKGRAHLDGGDPEKASRWLRQALELWTGPPLMGITAGRVLEAHLADLEEQRLRALEMRIDADLQTGRGRELIGELRFLVATNPLNEWFHGRLMTALCQVGRRNEALGAYRELQAVLDRELGLEPSYELRRLRYRMLDSQPVPARAASHMHDIAAAV